MCVQESDIVLKGCGDGLSKIVVCNGLSKIVVCNGLWVVLDCL
jgi:hypothetical protein